MMNGGSDVSTLIDSLLKGESKTNTVPEETPYKIILPEPGFCVKLKEDEGKKIFINVCFSDNVPEPRDLSDDALLELLESDDPTGFRIPMSLGEGHAEFDKKNEGCTAYDVIINTKFFSKIQSSELFRTFFLTVTIEGLESKYDISIKREWIILKNRKFIGSIVQQNVRSRSKPLIQDLSQEEFYSPRQPLVTEITNDRTDEPKGKEPKFSLKKEPPLGHPDYVVAEIDLPLIKTADSLMLDVGEDRLCLTTRSNAYLLDIYLPLSLIQEQTVAQFNRKTKILTVTLRVASS